MFLGYNTNGLTHHRLHDAVALLAAIGYRGVAITIDHQALPPPDSLLGCGSQAIDASDGERDLAGRAMRLPDRTAERLMRLRDVLGKYQMRSVIETGARFLLDPYQKHEPTLLSDSPQRRIAFYKYAIDCAAILGSDCVSIWSGTLHASLPRHQAMARLVAGLNETLDYAATKNVSIAFEPEPGMFIDSMAAFGELLKHIDRDNLKLTLDIGHLQCQGELPIAEVIRHWAPRLANVHLEDMRRGRHEHLMFGDGEIDFLPVFNALHDVGYRGGVYVELSRHSHAGHHAARQAFEWLQTNTPGMRP